MTLHFKVVQPGLFEIGDVIVLSLRHNKADFSADPLAGNPLIADIGEVAYGVEVIYLLFSFLALISYFSCRFPFRFSLLRLLFLFLLSPFFLCDRKTTMTMTM